ERAGLQPVPGRGLLLGIEVPDLDRGRRFEPGLRLGCPVRLAHGSAATNVSDGVCPTLVQRIGSYGRPVDAFVIDEAQQYVDPGVQRVCGFEQTEQVLRIRCADMADDVDRQQICAVGFD